MLALVAAVIALQSDPRHELGWRMQAFERAFRSEASSERRTQVLAYWERATQAFFAGRHDQAARALDEGRRQLAGEELAWSDGLALTPEARLIDGKLGALTLELTAFYALAAPASFELALQGSSWRAEVTSLPWSGTVPLEPGTSLPLELELRAGGALVARRSVALARADGLEARIDALAEWIESEGSAPGLLCATARGLHATLEELTWSGAGETFVDGARLLAAAEHIVAQRTLPDGLEHLWLDLAGAQLPLRVRCPEVEPGVRVPLVLALHGAGGSENLFFEGYGNGAILALAAERGWAVVAPRLAFEAPPDLEALVLALAQELPIDPQRVVLVGHSMGALVTTGALRARPAAFRAAALIAGAGPLQPAESWRTFPLFLATAEQDFARGGVERLRDQLVAGGVEQLTFRLYRASEHLTVVGEALPDVFRFFDRALAAPR